MESEEIRGVILKALHDKWIKTGQFFSATTTASDLSQETGIPVTDVIREAEYLGRKGLLKNIVANGQVFMPTEHGIDFARRPETFPHFASHIVINAGRDVTIASSQLGSAGAFQAVEAPHFDEISSILSELRQNLQAAVIEKSTHQEVTANIDSLAAQVSRPSPKADILRPLFHDLTATVQATAALAELWPKFERLGRLLAPLWGGGTS